LSTGAKDWLDGAHGHVCAALCYFESSIDLCGVVVVDNVMELGLILRLDVLAARDREIGCWDWDFEKGKHGGESGDGADVEVIPSAKVANVPPEVVVDTPAHGSDAADKAGGGVGAGQVIKERRSRSRRLEAVEANFGSEGILDSWCRLVFGNGELWARRGI
jgi:hypothetical protein